ncbi:hypothetical protein [Actinomadura violacea]|uniref:Uncharacterized protein n=1 Tax=Actinomadura violacea TaxID=2819934 RepID=A0ABS3RQ56_9ACTN|nr:hypothetical protein [Actinomadura violacea]MBO2458878.1 hypothetical protein [Actinomadura violacea]
MAEAAESKKGGDDLPDTPSAKGLQVLMGICALVGGLPALVGLGGLIFTFFFGHDFYRWLVLFLGGMIGVVAAMGLQGQATTAVPTHAWREPGGAVPLVLRRVTALAAIVLAAAGPSLFLLKLVGWLSTDTSDAYYHAPVVTVSISGECSTRVGGSPQDFTDKVSCGSASWTVGGKQVNGKIEGTVLEIVGKVGLDGATHKDSAKAHVRGTIAYTLHAVHKPHSCARLDGLPAWAWAGLPVGVLGFIGIGRMRWSPEAPHGPFED